MNKAKMLSLGPKKSLSSLRLELMALGMEQCTDDMSRVWYHLTIQAPTSNTKTCIGYFWGNVWNKLGYI